MHKPVLLNEVINFLQPDSGTLFVDGTAGDGGYIREILKNNPKSKVLGIDLDQASLDKLSMQLAQESLSQRTTLIHGNFAQIAHLANEHGFVPADAVILDLGFSSSQLDDETYGLSFQLSGPLDMRLDKSAKIRARDLVNKLSTSELAKTFAEFGEEKYSGKIASVIVREREKEPIETTGQLFALIEQALPKPVRYKASDSARRIFQALRIAVNNELDNLKKALPQILEILAPGGRMLVISFHSLEDRIVKEFLNDAAKGCICPPEFPTCVCGRNPLMKILTKKPVRATESEILNNSRSKPAKLRVAVRIKN